MHNRKYSILLTGCILLITLALTGSHTSSSGKTLTVSAESNIQNSSVLEASATPEVTGRSIFQYPGPEITETQLYPGPQETETQPFFSPTATNTATLQGNTPSPTQTKSKTLTPSSQPSGTLFATPTPTPSTGTPVASPTELPIKPPLSPPPAGSNISIWHSWNSAESEVLDKIVGSFQKLYPDVTFDLRYIPADDLYTNYQEAAYLGQGPSLLLGPAQWGPSFFQSQLVIDLTPYVPSDYLSTINQAALASGYYHGALASLPLSQHGIVMFRNTALVPQAPKTVDELIDSSLAATHSGNVGSYLERGAYFSSANIFGLGGGLMDNNNMPVFNDLPGLDWINLLRQYDDAGAVTFNTNLDLYMFKRGRVGIIIDGTWNINPLRQALGDDKLSIDAWPSFGNGHMTGWVEADSVYLNSNVTGDNRFAALAFIGYLLDSNVQLRLAEVGHIPTVLATKPRDPLIQEAAGALSGGVPYPIGVDDKILNAYFTALNNAIKDVFFNGVRPEEALKSATNELTQMLINSTIAP
jgi:maltose-binding protein MalE